MRKKSDQLAKTVINELENAEANSTYFTKEETDEFAKIKQVHDRCVKYFSDKLYNKLSQYSGDLICFHLSKTSLTVNKITIRFPSMDFFLEKSGVFNIFLHGRKRTGKGANKEHYYTLRVSVPKPGKVTRKHYCRAKARHKEQRNQLAEFQRNISQSYGNRFAIDLPDIMGAHPRKYNKLNRVAVRLGNTLYKEACSLNNQQFRNGILNLARDIKLIHDADNIHGDLKPENVIVVDGRWYIIDWDELQHETPPPGNCDLEIVTTYRYLAPLLLASAIFNRNKYYLDEFAQDVVEYDFNALIQDLYFIRSFTQLIIDLMKIDSEKYIPLKSACKTYYDATMDEKKTKEEIDSAIKTLCNYLTLLMNDIPDLNLKPSTKDDCYSFGMMLLFTITIKRSPNQREDESLYKKCIRGLTQVDPAKRWSMAKFLTEFSNESSTDPDSDTDRLAKRPKLEK